MSLLVPEPTNRARGYRVSSSGELRNMKVRVPLPAMIALLALATIPPGARAADLIVSNLTEPHSSFDTLRAYVPPNTSGWDSAQGFTTGTSSYLLDTISANLGDFDPGPNDDYTFSADLYAANSDGTPGTFLTSFNHAAVPASGFADVVFNPITQVLLSAGTTYLFVLKSSSADGKGGVAWSYADTFNSSGPGTLPYFNTSYDGGATWNGPFAPPTGGAPYLIQVNGTPPVPEPGSWLLSAIGFGAALKAARRFRPRRAG